MQPSREPKRIFDTASAAYIALDEKRSELWLHSGQHDKLTVFGTDGTYSRTVVMKGLTRPRGFAVLPDSGHVVVADEYSSMVTEYDKDGQIVRGVAEVAKVRGLCIDRHGRVFACSPHMKRVEMYRNIGSDGLDRRRHFPTDGSAGSVVAVATDSKGRVIAADEQGNRVLIMDADGAIVAVIGPQISTDDNKSSLKQPCALAVGLNDYIYVADDSPFVRVFDPSGKLVDTFGGQGGSPGQFVRPGGIAVDSEGNVYVSDKVLPRVQVF